MLGKVNQGHAELCQLEPRDCSKQIEKTRQKGLTPGQLNS